MTSAIVAPASWTPCDPARLPGAAPRFEAAPVAAYTRGARLLRLDLPGRSIVAKRMPGEAVARTLFALVQALAARCAHVPPPSLASSGDGRAWWLCAPYLEGVPWLQQGGPQSIAGEALASLHAAMRCLPGEDIRAEAARRSARVLGWLDRNAGAVEVRSLAACAGLEPEGLRRALDAYLAAPAQPVHHDLHPGNVWWAEDRLWFLDFEELASGYLPVAADLARYLERHLLVAPAADPDRALAEFWGAYAQRAAAPMPGAAELFAALAWNWLDSWSTLHAFSPRPADFASERAKFLDLLQHHSHGWKRFAARLAALPAA